VAREFVAASSLPQGHSQEFAALSGRPRFRQFIEFAIRASSNRIKKSCADISEMIGWLEQIDWRSVRVE
jgi:hypothetical protein